MKPFFDLSEQYSAFDSSKIVILPIPYEKTTSYQKGTEKGPLAIHNASMHLELFDEVLEKNTYTHGIFTDTEFWENPFSSDHEDIGDLKRIENRCTHHLNHDKFIVSIGGEHTIAYPVVKAHLSKYPNMSVIQIDAHADLREVYENSRYSHGCVMRRIYDEYPHPERLFQIGIRSLSEGEFRFIKKEKINTYFSHMIRSDGQKQWMAELISKLTTDVYITVDVDGFDPSIIPGTGTPEPFGIDLDIYDNLVKQIVASGRNIVGFDVNELMPIPNSTVSEFISAKLIYRSLGRIIN